MIVIEKVLEVEILKSGLIINFYGHDALDVGLIEINRIKQNGELQTFEFHLCKTKDFHEFKKYKGKTKDLFDWRRKWRTLL